MVKLTNRLVAGETLKARLCHSTATAISMIFVGPDKHTVSLTSTAEGWNLSQSTEEWLPGDYFWQLWVTVADEKSVGGNGKLTLAPSLESAEAGTDFRTIAQRNIDAINLMLQGKAEKGVRRYKINNRELESYSITELLELLKYWKGERRAELPRRRRGPNIRVSL